MQRIVSGEPSANLGLNFVVTMSLSSSIMSTKLGISFKKARSQIFHLCSTIFIMQKNFMFWMFEMATNKFKNKNPSALTLLKYSDSLYCLFTVK